ncbi:DUF4393 domain-containing protein [Kiritimatiellota bacterium B12222]|nr:DUF4393 domain-containing protein [Kiritimatiellota bacterium B12222]
MAEDKRNKIEDTINAVTGLAKAVPIYDDALQPAAKEIGKSLETVAKTVNVALAPLRALVWGYDQIEGFVSKNVTEKLRNTPKEEIISPSPNVAGPALEALRYAGHEESLRELYANLLASSMDAATASTAHPGFVEILKQITPDEAKLLVILAPNRPLPLLNVRAENKDRNMGGRDVLVNFSLYGEEAGCEHVHLTPSYLDNLSRLGLIEVPTFYEYKYPNVYAPLENHPTVKAVKEQIEQTDTMRCVIQKRGIRVTQLGRQFINSCVVDHASKRPENKSEIKPT